MPPRCRPTFLHRRDAAGRVLQSAAWFAVVGAAQNPGADRRADRAHIAEAIRQPDIRKRFDDLSGLSSESGQAASPAEPASFMREESKSWKQSDQAAKVVRLE